MKVSCPGCTTSYCVEDGQIPFGGAKVNCPTCGARILIGTTSARTGRALLAIPHLRPKLPPKPAMPAAAAAQTAGPDLEPYCDEERWLELSFSGQNDNPLELADSGDNWKTAVVSEPSDEQAEAYAAWKDVVNPGADLSDLKSDPSGRFSLEPFPPPAAKPLGVSTIRAQSGAAARKAPPSQTPPLSPSQLEETQEVEPRPPSSRTRPAPEEKTSAPRPRTSGTRTVPATSARDGGLELDFGFDRQPKVPGQTGASPLRSRSPDDLESLNQASAARAGWAVVAIALVVVAALSALIRYGVVELPAGFPSSLLGSPPEAPRPREAPSARGALSRVPKVAPEELHRLALSSARRSLRAGRFVHAALEFLRALSVKPDSLEAVVGLVEAYDALGDRDRADAWRAKISVTGLGGPRKGSGGM